MSDRPDPLRAYDDAVRAGDRRLASLLAARLFRRPVAGPSGSDLVLPPSPAARATFRRLRDHLGL